MQQEDRKNVQQFSQSSQKKNEALAILKGQKAENNRQGDDVSTTYRGGCKVVQAESQVVSLISQSLIPFASTCHYLSLTSLLPAWMHLEHHGSLL